jgi:hypothetical protein
MDLILEEFLSTGAIGSRRFLCSLGVEREATPVLLNLVAGTQNCNPRVLRQTAFFDHLLGCVLWLQRDGKSQLAAELIMRRAPA